jgi:hypothetical protein
LALLTFEKSGCLPWPIQVTQDFPFFLPKIISGIINTDFSFESNENDSKNGVYQRAFENAAGNV